MNIEIIENPDQELIDFLSNKIVEFNWQHRELNERKPLVVQLKNEAGDVIAGAAGKTFGNWLLLETLWVSEELRGQDVGSQLLNNIEQVAKRRGCITCLLDTLNFQAMPFYKKHGYEVQWIQQDYPLTGCKYFMIKQL